MVGENQLLQLSPDLHTRAIVCIGKGRPVKMTSAENSTSTFVTLTLEFVSSLGIRSKDIFLYCMEIKRC